MTPAAADWSSLSADKLEIISSRVSSDADYVRFRSVCTSWRSAAPKKPFNLPWLIVRKYAIDDADADGRGNSSTLRICNFPNISHLFTPQLPQGLARGKYIFGSSLGWLGLSHDDEVLYISLYNPCTGRHVRLPPLPELPTGDNPIPRFLLMGLVLPSDPVAAPDECVVMTTFFNRQNLIYCRPGDTTWTPLSSLPSEYSWFEDITFYNGRFYAVSGYRVFVCDTGPEARATQIPPAKPLFVNREPRREGGTGIPSICQIERYLVVSSGELLLAKILWGKPMRCEVFRVDLGGGQLRLVKLQNLGGRSLFLGSRSMSLSAGSSPRCKENCVYYLDHYVEVSGDSTEHIREDRTTIINLEDGSTSSIASPSDEVSGTHWLTPSLC